MDAPTYDVDWIVVGSGFIYELCFGFKERIDQRGFANAGCAKKRPEQRL